ncbi:MAG: DUF5716 family protein [Candidatus Thiodiazotropha sp.]|nr:DUF5716 family protein [Candidatus Thiodiazotropha sp.]
MFERLPERLFSPLSGGNRRVYAALILDLYPLFFDQIHADVFPSKETVRHEIEERLATMSLVWQVEDEVPFSQERDGNYSSIAYRRLLDAGWFEEENEGYRVRVAVPPAVGTLWGSLMEITRPDQVFYGGIVLSIYNNVQKAIEDPDDQVLALRQAAQEARRFLQHLNTMIYGLKGLLGEISGVSDHRAVLSHFFDDFVERILVQDYKRLKTRNNPFRYRQQILSLIHDLEYDVDKKKRLVDAFMAQAGSDDSERAWQAINNDIDKLRGVFEQVDSHLARVDLYRAKVERRVADTVRYLDRSQPGMATHIAGLLKQLGDAVESSSDDSELFVVMPLIDVAPVAPQSLREAPRSRIPPDPRPLRTYALDPAVQARQKALRTYLDRRRIDPKRLASYLEREMGAQNSIHGTQLSIKGVEDFIAFTHVRHLEYLPGAQRLTRHYVIERKDGWIDNEWLRCPDFVVHRRGTLGNEGGATNAA